MRRIARSRVGLCLLGLILPLCAVAVDVHVSANGSRIDSSATFRKTPRADDRRRIVSRDSDRAHSASFKHAVDSDDGRDDPWQLGFLDDLRTYRDTVMKRSASGRELARVYDRHGHEILRILRRNPVLAWKTAQSVARGLPAIRAAIHHKTAAEFESDDFRHGLKVMMEIERHASVDLRRSLRSVRSLLRRLAVPKPDRVVIDFRGSQDPESHRLRSR